jgi:serine/threonine-protein kinase
MSEPSPAGPETLPTSWSAALRDRYVLARLHATGGIGRVWLARDEELGRPVAVKDLRPERTDPAARARFLEEAQITGQLEHPGVVPVYDLVRGCGSQPAYYVMRFVNGRTLREAIRAYHEQRALGRHDPVEQRVLLQAFVSVCQTVAYAHARGVIHRDLKPANVVLGDFGEVLVLDWGLAHLMNRPDPTAGLPAVQLSGADEREATLAGAVVGTPAYMAPEQAAGDLEHIDPRTDIYGLGAILYEVLTGQPPHSGPDLASLLHHVREQDPVRPRQLLATTPLALEAICRKALARRMEDRYTSARELALDVQRWLADEPVSAWREPWRLRAGRWLRHHRAGFAAVLAASLVGVLFLIGLVLLQRVAYAEVAAQRNLAGAQRDRARAHFQRAREAVDRFYVQVSESPEMKARGLEKLRARLLESAQEYYRQFGKDEGDDFEVLRERGLAQERLGMLYEHVGRLAQAEQTTREALAVFEGLAAAEPADPRHRCEQAVCAGNLAGHLFQSQRYAEAETACGEALRLLQELTAARPDELLYRERLAQSQHQLSVLCDRTGRSEEAGAAAAEALALRRQLADAQPGVPRAQYELALSHSFLATLDQHRLRLEAAEENLHEAMAIQQTLVDSGATEPEFAVGLARDRTARARLLALKVQLPAAEKEYLAARRSQRRLVEEHPEVPTYRQDLTVTLRGLTSVYRGLKDLARAEDAAREGVSVSEALVEEFADLPDLIEDLADCRACLGELLRARGHSAEGRALLEQACDALVQLIGAHPGVPQYRMSLAVWSVRLAELHREAKRTDLAEACYRLARSHLEDLRGRYPLLRPVAHDLGVVLFRHAMLVEERDRKSDAIDLLKEAIRVEEHALEQTPEDRELMGNLASSWFQLGRLLENDRREAERAYQQSVARRREQLNGGIEPPDRALDLFSALKALALARSRLRRSEEAIGSAREAVALGARLAREYPKDPKTQETAAEARVVLGRVLQAAGRRDEAQPDYEAALATCRALGPNPSLEARWIASEAHNSLSEIFRARDQYAVAERHSLEEVRLRRELAEAAPADLGTAVNLGGSLCNLGMCRAGLNRHADAVADYDEANRVLRPLVLAPAPPPNARPFLRNVQLARARSLDALGRLAEMLAAYDQSVRLSDEPDRARLAAERQQKLLREIHAARVRAEKGEHEEAAARLDELARLASAEGAEQYALACGWGAAAITAGQDAALPAVERQRRQEAYAGVALSHLEEAHAAGLHADPKFREALAQEPALAAVRERAGFRKLLEGP